MDERRDIERILLGSEFLLRTPAIGKKGIILDISAGGCKIETSAELSVGATVLMHIKGHGEITGSVMWVNGVRSGVRFLSKLDDETLRRVIETAPPSTRVNAA